MPYPHEHACRLRDPGEFAAGSFRSMHRMHGGKPYRVILGKLAGVSGPDDPLVEQTYRYPTDAWTEGEARAHCREHGGGLFEPAAPPRRRE
ncbi:MAG TPA: hypothetical protein VMG41_03250 [Gemmatimonadales bacterium]|nr:hypothetical protein [Gemmatimonadales bacterium]